MPAPAAVPENDWTLLEPPERDGFEPDTRVSVLVEGSPGAAADPTIAGLVRQSYPPELVDVIGPGENRAPKGDLVVLLPVGAIPEPHFLVEHARWHGAADDLVSLGPAAGPGDPFGLVVDLTRGLTDPQQGLMLGATLGSLGVRRETYLAAAPTPNDERPGDTRITTTPGRSGRGEWGAGRGEWVLGRLDLAHRLACYGAVFVPESAAAAAWDGDDFGAGALARAIADAAANGRTLELDEPQAASLIPLRPFRAVGSARRFRRPAVVVNIPVPAGTEEADLLATAEAVLGGRLGDLELRLQVHSRNRARAACESLAEGDPRVRVAPSSTEGHCESPFQVVLPAIALPDPRTIADLQRLLIEERAGVLHVTVPGAPPLETMIHAYATGALARARRVAEATGEEVEVVLGRLFGERWVSGVEVSVLSHGVEEPHVTEHGPLAAASDLRHERSQHLRFRDRADDLEERAAGQAQRVLADRLRARAERLRADRLEARLRP